MSRQDNKNCGETENQAQKNEWNDWSLCVSDGSFNRDRN